MLLAWQLYLTPRRRSSDSARGSVRRAASARVVTDENKAVIQCRDYLPFGGEILASSQNERNGIPCYSADTGLRQKFTGKERDAESRLDFFEARYFSWAQGRFTSPDPVVITPERFSDPQQINLYSYVRNNPLRLIDPTGEVLVCTGSGDDDRERCMAVLVEIAGEAGNRLSANARTRVVSLDTQGLDLSTNEGANLLNDLVTSSSKFGFSVGPTIETQGGTVQVDYIKNLPLFENQFAHRLALDTELPKGVDAQVGFNPNHPQFTLRSNTNLELAVPFTVVFHELAEAYGKVDGGKGGSYDAGHNATIPRENRLRDQRPYLKDHNPGSGGPAGKGDTTRQMIRR